MMEQGARSFSPILTPASVGLVLICRHPSHTRISSLIGEIPARAGDQREMTLVRLAYKRG